MRARAAAIAVSALLLLLRIPSLPGGAPPATAGSLPRNSFAAAPEVSILVHGTYAAVSSSCVAPVQPLLHARYHGVIEVGKDSDGTLFVVDVVPLEEYLKGIAEVPRTWKMEALKAQVVAARSYALAHLGNPGSTGERLGYDLCSTDACQVYRGLGISDGPYGDRWTKAVDQTATEVLMYQGRPADTVYFSTSKGRTLGNEAVFGSAALPYLRPVDEKDDGTSPLSHWTVSMPLDDVARFLEAAGAWSSKPVSNVVRDGPDVVVSGGGESMSMPITDFRADMNAWSHCLDPGHYPTVGTGGARLPQTVPSKWFSTSKVGSSLVLTGRGWGHGVGMVQYGAQGKAERGLAYDDILAYYYGGLRPVPFAEPDVIRVGVAVGLESVRIEGTGPVTVEGRSPGPGPWIVTGGDHLGVHQAGPPPSYISPGNVATTPKRLRAGQSRPVTVNLPQLSVVRLVLRMPGPDIPLSEPRTEPAGSARVSAVVPEGVPSGTYDLQAVVTNGIDIVRTASVRIPVLGGPPASPSPTTPPSPGPSPPPASPVALPPSNHGPGGLPVVIGAASVALVAASAWLLRRRRRHATS